MPLALVLLLTVARLGWAAGTAPGGLPPGRGGSTRAAGALCPLVRPRSRPRQGARPAARAGGKNGARHFALYGELLLLGTYALGTAVTLFQGSASTYLALAGAVSASAEGALWAFL